MTEFNTRPDDMVQPFGRRVRTIAMIARMPSGAARKRLITRFYEWRIITPERAKILIAIFGLEAA